MIIFVFPELKFLPFQQIGAAACPNRIPNKTNTILSYFKFLRFDVIYIDKSCLLKLDPLQNERLKNSYTCSFFLNSKPDIPCYVTAGFDKFQAPDRHEIWNSVA